MPPQPHSPSTTSSASELHSQTKNPSEIFSILLLLGPDIVAQSLAQLTGTLLTPTTFSFGWVAYSVSALVSACGANNNLMPRCPIDSSCLVINARTGYARENRSWIIGRIVRDYCSKWIHSATRARFELNLDDKYEALKQKAVKTGGELQRIKRPTRAGLCVGVYRPSTMRHSGKPVKDLVYYSGFFTTVLQLVIAAIPCGISGDWGTLAVTVIGTILALVSGSLPQWRKEKWACRRNTEKDVILVSGNGAQHAILILGNGHGLDLEDLATSATAIDTTTRLFLGVLAIAWVVLLIVAAGFENNSWFLLAVGAVGIFQNLAAAGFERDPAAVGIHLDFVEVVGHHKVMEALYGLEAKYPGAGASTVPIFFPGDLNEGEESRWNDFKTARKRSGTG